MPQPRVDIAVGGKFHADQLTRFLLAHGCDAHLWSSFPASRFPAVPHDRVHWLPSPEIAYRLCRTVQAENLGQWWKMRWFGASLARRLMNQKRPGDIFIGWSSFCLETLKSTHYRHKAVVRDSAHISTQLEILDQEYGKRGLVFSRMSRFKSALIDRECQEYERADTIWVLSEFARKSFLQHGIAKEKLQLVRLGVDVSLFRPASPAPELRLPLRVVYFGSISVQKGIPYLLEAVRDFSDTEIELTLIGAVEPALKPLLKENPRVRLFPPCPQAELVQRLHGQHVFIMPTLHDGFGQTVIQAMASGLVPLATDRCGAAEVIEPGKTGFIVPAGDAGVIRAHLARWIQSPQSLAVIRDRAIAASRNQSWERYGKVINAWIDRLDPAQEGRVRGAAVRH